MPYRKVVFHAGEYYHLYNRGNNYQPVFFERENYLYFLRQLREYLLPALIDIVAYCLMPNHYHFLVYLKTDDLAGMMQPFLLSYTKAINKRYQRIGSLFQGRFKGLHVDRHEYLLHLSRYIHLNPVIAGLASKPEDWEYSSYREYAGLRDGTLPRPAPILSQFLSVADYRRFVEAYVEGDEQIIKHLILE